MDTKKHKRGDVRESDGMVFWAYQRNSRGERVEYWMTPMGYVKLKDRQKRYMECYNRRKRHYGY